MKGIKIAIVGDPHSGKSVFLGGLKENLPRDMYYLFRACPDGEGSWTWKGQDTATYRRKGTFSKEIVSWYCGTLRRALAPVTLVDVGGRRSEENSRILSMCDYCVILSNTRESIGEWSKYMRGLGVPCVYKVWSCYDDCTDRVYNDNYSTVYHLERGEDVSTRSTIKRVAARIMDMAAEIKSDLSESGDNVMENIIRIADIASALNKSEETKTLPNGKVVSSVQWNGSDLVEVSRLLHNHSYGANDAVGIDGAAPGWLVAAICHEVHPAVASINSPDGYVVASCGEPREVPQGNNLTWSVKTEGGITTVTVQQADPSVPLSPADMAGWCPPAVPFGTTVILSGRMPNWGMSAIAMAYHGKAKACALFQPGVGSTVCWTHSQDVALGSVIK